jgi:hypothetical protein
MSRLTTYGGVTLPFFQGQRTVHLAKQQAWTPSEGMHGVHLTHGDKALPIAEATISSVFRIDKTYASKLTIGPPGRQYRPGGSNADLETVTNYLAAYLLALDPSLLTEDLSQDGGAVYDALDGTIVNHREAQAIFTEWEVTKPGAGIKEVTFTWLVMSGMWKLQPSGHYIVLV